MIKVRKSKERGHANHGWLDTHYTFSFSDYYDPRFQGFRNLRVINEDFIEADQGFPKHGHRDMEIITYMIEGELSHKDSMGNGETIRPNEVQRMTAGDHPATGSGALLPVVHVVLLEDARRSRIIDALYACL